MKDMQARSAAKPTSQAERVYSPPFRPALAGQRFCALLKEGALLAVGAGIVLMATPALVATGLVGALHRVTRRSRLLTGLLRRITGGIDVAAERIAPYVLKDARDWDVLPIIAYASVFIVPLYFWMLFSGELEPGLVLVYLGLMLGPGMTMFVTAFSAKHREAHRGTFFKGRLGKLLGRYCERVIGVFYGNVPGLEFPTHVLIHHGEHDTDDLQDPLRFNRMHLTEFLRYLVLGSLFTNSGVGPIRKLYQMGKWKMLRVMCTGFTGFYLFVAVSLWLNWRVALLCLVVPLCTNIFNLAVVVWAQHGFADPDDLSNPNKVAVTLVGVDTPGNENYHMTHHLKPGYHWRDLPGHFAAHEAELARQGHLVFHGLKLTEIWLLMCVRKRHDLLAQHLVSPPLASQEDAVALLRRQMGWVRPSSRIQGVTAA